MAKKTHAPADAGSGLIRTAEKSAAPKPEMTTSTEAPASRRSFEVLGTLHLGTKDGVKDVRKQGDVVYSDEIGDAAMIQYLIEHKRIVDTNAPVPPSQADATLAFSHLVDVAKETGALVLNGSEFHFSGNDETVFHGFTELRKRVSIGQLKAAIVARVNR